MLLIHPGENFDEGARYIVALRGLRTVVGQEDQAEQGLQRAQGRQGAEAPAQALQGHLQDAQARGHRQVEPDPRVGLHRRLREGPDRAHAPHPQRRVRPARRPQPRRRQDRGQRAAVHDHQGRRQPRPADPAPHLRHVHRALLPQRARAARPARRFNYASKGKDALPAQRSGNTQTAKFECAIPVAAATAPAHAALYGHGLLGGPDEIDEDHIKDMSQEHDFAFCATAWSGMSAEDVPNAIKLLGNLSDFASLADRNQQGFLNQMYLGRLLHPPAGADRQPRVRRPRRPVAAVLRRQQPGRHPRHRADRDGARLHARGARRARDQLLGAADPQLELGHLRRGLQPRLPAPGRPAARAVADQPAVGSRRGRRLGAPRDHRPAGGHARAPRADACRGRRLPGHDLPGRRARAHDRRLRAQAGLPPRPLARAGADVPASRR